MGGEWKRRNAWRASKEYEPWANVPKPSTYIEYRNTYQRWRTTQDLPPKKMKHCGCGGLFQAHNKHFVKRHNETAKHRLWEKEQENKKPKRMIIYPKKRVVCKFLW